MINYGIEYIDTRQSLELLVERLNEATAIALDIETINWWDRTRERISVIQIAFREQGDLRVGVIDVLAGFDLESLRRPLELNLQTKAIHNASFDAVRLARHLGIATSPVHDTMLAARRSGEKKCSLQAQVKTHLGFDLDKTEQQGDWSRRPLDPEQLQYAALDAACTLILFEQQMAKGLRGDYQLREKIDKRPSPLSVPLQIEPSVVVDGELAASALALLGIVVELSGRYSPEQLAASTGSERIGMAGWIIDNLIGTEADIDENTARDDISMLTERGLITLSLSRRLETTSLGESTWKRQKKFK
ncbi:MAG: ribonuclease D [Acidobacteria bacterium]|nr:ribonuclease D [Acidobacteriota bacterium]